ncbi:MAG TPA: hypothetical protein VFH37_01780 [Candidatus Saccharimonadales bacterium]|nr:hypothetical protein [Candidatus Saccharimonadales bacterium]
MGELVYRIKNKNLPNKALREKYQSIDHIKETGRVVIYGIEKGTNKKRRIAAKKLIEYYGYDPTHKPKPEKASWRGAFGDQEVTVIGSYGSGGNDEFMKVRGSKTGIPRSELTWHLDTERLSGNNNTSSPAEIKPADEPESIRLLREQMDAMRADMQQVSSENARLSGEVESLGKQVKRVVADNSRLEAENERLKDENRKLENRLEAYARDDIPVMLIPSETPSQSRFKSAMNRSAGWIGSKLPWASPPVYGPGRVEETADGSLIRYVEEERHDGYTAYERKRGAAVLVGALVVGASVLAAGLWGEHEENEGRQSQIHKTEIIQQQRNHLSAELKAAEAHDAKDDATIKAQRIAKATEEALEKSKQRTEEALEKSKQRAEEKNETKVHATGEVFNVEYGNGITNEIQDYARAHGYHEVSGGQAWMLYENMREHFGENLIELPGGGNDTYIRADGDVGISRPGPAMWPEQVEQFLQNRLSR